jgi:hypothetical protein
VVDLNLKTPFFMPQALGAHLWRAAARRIGVDEDLAGAAICLASRAGDDVVGSTLIVAGGVTHARS